MYIHGREKSSLGALHSISILRVIEKRKASDDVPLSGEFPLRKHSRKEEQEGKPPIKDQDQCLPLCRYQIWLPRTDI